MRSWYMECGWRDCCFRLHELCSWLLLQCWREGRMCGWYLERSGCIGSEPVHCMRCRSLLRWRRDECVWRWHVREQRRVGSVRLRDMRGWILLREWRTDGMRYKQCGDWRKLGIRLCELRSWILL